MCGLATVLNIFRGFLKTQDVLLLSLLVFLAHPLLLLLIIVILLVFLAGFGYGNHLACAGIEVLNVYVGVAVDIDIGVKEHQLGYGLGLLGDPPQEALGDLRARGLRIFASRACSLALKHPTEVPEGRSVRLHGLHQPGYGLDVLFGTADQLLKVLWVILQAIIEQLFVQADRGKFWDILRGGIYGVLIGHLIEEDGLMRMRLLVVVGLLHIREVCG